MKKQKTDPIKIHVQIGDSEQTDTYEINDKKPVIVTMWALPETTEAEQVKAFFDTAFEALEKLPAEQAEEILTEYDFMYEFVVTDDNGIEWHMSNNNLDR